MLDRRSSSSLSFIRMDEHGSSPRLGVDSSWHSTLWRSSKDLPSIQTKLHKRWAIPACLFATTFGCFCLVTLALGLGLGLGWRRYGSTSRTLQVNNSSYYGISEGLEVISSSALINAKELALDTGFVVSNQPRTREYVFNISQALAAPDGFEKPMILANGQSPGPLIEVNIGDTGKWYPYSFSPSPSFLSRYRQCNSPARARIRRIPHLCPRTSAGSIRVNSYTDQRHF